MEKSIKIEKKSKFKLALEALMKKRATMIDLFFDLVIVVFVGALGHELPELVSIRSELGPTLFISRVITNIWTLIITLFIWRIVVKIKMNVVRESNTFRLYILFIMFLLLSVSAFHFLQTEIAFENLDQLTSASDVGLTQNLQNIFLGLVFLFLCFGHYFLVRSFEKTKTKEFKFVFYSRLTVFMLFIALSIINATQIISNTSFVIGFWITWVILAVILVILIFSEFAVTVFIKGDSDFKKITINGFEYSFERLGILFIAFLSEGLISIFTNFATYNENTLEIWVLILIVMAIILQYICFWWNYVSTFSHLKIKTNYRSIIGTLALNYLFIISIFLINISFTLAFYDQAFYAELFFLIGLYIYNGSLIFISLRYTDFETVFAQTRHLKIGIGLVLFTVLSSFAILLLVIFWNDAPQVTIRVCSSLFLIDSIFNIAGNSYFSYRFDKLNAAKKVTI